jgi:hypothetical protein
MSQEQEWYNADLVTQEVGNEGYALALVDAQTNRVIEAYFDSGNWQWLEFPTIFGGLTRCQNYLGVIHSGQLEFCEYF